MRSGFFQRLRAQDNPGPDVVELVPGLSIRVRVSARAQRFSLKLDRRDHQPELVLPQGADRNRAIGFARANVDWIRQRLDEQPGQTAVTAGQTIEIFGQAVQLLYGTSRARRLTDDSGLLVGFEAPDDAAFGDRIVRLIRNEARTYFVDRTAWYADQLDQPVPGISLGDARGRWGSCRKAHGRTAAAIRYSWRLALAPEPVADYVAAHECAHLIEANHGPNFWKLVRDLAGDPAAHRRWLRQNGAKLQAFRVSARD